MGVLLFFESYFHAFAYLVAPGFTVQRSVLYPNTKRRIANMLRAAKRFGIDPPDSYDLMFIDQAEPTDQKMALLLSLADGAAQSVVDELIAQVEQIANDKHVPLKSLEKVEAAMGSFRLMIPATNIGDLGNLLNAGWRAYHDESLWL